MHGVSVGERGRRPRQRARDAASRSRRFPFLPGDPTYVESRLRGRVAPSPERSAPSPTSRSTATGRCSAVTRRLSRTGASGRPSFATSARPALRCPARDRRHGLGLEPAVENVLVAACSRRSGCAARDALARVPKASADGRRPAQPSPRSPPARRDSPHGAPQFPRTADQLTGAGPDLEVLSVLRVTHSSTLSPAKRPSASARRSRVGPRRQRRAERRLGAASSLRRGRLALGRSPRRAEAAGTTRPIGGVRTQATDWRQFWHRARSGTVLLARASRRREASACTRSADPRSPARTDAPAARAGPVADGESHK